MPTTRWRAAVATLSLAATTPPAGAAPPIEQMAARLEELRDELIGVRRDLHRHAEPSGEEERTARVVAARLRKLGLEVETGVGGHGVVAILRGGKPGGVVGYRTDMDATRTDLPDPVTEIASVNRGVRHICGHDVHTAVALGVAEALAAVRDELPGTVKLIFQPAEENARGARAMVAEGALAAPTPEAIFAVHSAPLAAGQIGAIEGVTLVARDRATVVISGTGARAAAARAAAEVLRGAATLEAPESFAELAAMPLPAEEFVLVNIQRVDEEELTASVMPRSEVGREGFRSRVEQDLAALAFDSVELELRYEPKVVAGVFSDPELVRGSHDAIRAALGDGGLVVTTGAGPAFSEDFGAFLEEIPGAMFWLGVASPERGIVGMPHTPDHAVDEEAIPVGARAMAAVLFDYLEKRGSAGSAKTVR